MTSCMANNSDETARPTRSWARRRNNVSTLRRPATAVSPEFDIGYVRTGPRSRGGSGAPVLVLPGGPGVASIGVYPRFRAAAAKRGLDVLMADHRGVAFSRQDTEGRDLPPEAMTLAAAVDDYAALLDAEGIDRVVVAGCSYGTTVAQVFGLRHPERVAAMVLDSTVLTAEDYREVRRHSRALLWQGDDPELADLAAKIRILAQCDGVDPLPLGEAAGIMYEFGGRALLERYLAQLARGQARVTQTVIRRLVSQEVTKVTPGIMEMDLVARIAFTELNYYPEPDGMIFDPAYSTAEAGRLQPPFQGEPFDLPAALPGFEWLTAVVSGARDLRTPRSIAERTVSLLPDGVLVPVAEMGHSALDTHSGVFIEVARAVRDSDRTRLAEIADTGGSDIRRRGASGLLGPLLRALLVAEKPAAPLVRSMLRRPIGG